MLFSAVYLIPVTVIVALALLKTSVKIFCEYERAVVFTLGRFQKVEGSGNSVLLISFFQETGTSGSAYPGHRDTNVRT